MKRAPGVVCLLLFPHQRRAHSKYSWSIAMESRNVLIDDTREDLSPPLLWCARKKHRTLVSNKEFECLGLMMVFRMRAL
ncbi:hypothetical protein CEXT_65481 [Caerostris extrusa]|uniref:Secreted protein n=1 Tax=Caerostris extrusa TaxID=172846 RepID=A0AAV4V4G0_CAEEX|nr:hypothetical protein CEXT_65481 [Caerostris extrusa]